MANGKEVSSAFGVSVGDAVWFYGNKLGLVLKIRKKTKAFEGKKRYYCTVVACRALVEWPESRADCENSLIFVSMEHVEIARREDT